MDHRTCVGWVELQVVKQSRLSTAWPCTDWVDRLSLPVHHFARNVDLCVVCVLEMNDRKTEKMLKLARCIVKTVLFSGNEACMYHISYSAVSRRNISFIAGHSVKSRDIPSSPLNDQYSTRVSKTVNTSTTEPNSRQVLKYLLGMWLDLWWRMN